VPGWLQRCEARGEDTSSHKHFAHCIRKQAGHGFEVAPVNLTDSTVQPDATDLLFSVVAVPADSSPVDLTVSAAADQAAMAHMHVHVVLCRVHWIAEELPVVTQQCCPICGCLAFHWH